MRYDDEKLERAYMEQLAAQRGTEMHDYAAQAIKLRQRQHDDGTTLSTYINECIGWRMQPEVALFWSIYAFGRADAIGFSEREGILRISDLKTGRGATKFDQLVVYAALFYLEYELKPFDFDTELRIYQSNRVKEHFPDPDDIFKAMDRIISGTRILEAIDADRY